MLDEYKEKIKIDRENLSTMPKSNAKNVRIYKEKLYDIREEYDNDLNLVFDEIKRRNVKYQECSENKEIGTLSENVIKLREMMPLLNVFSSSYSKSGLDSVLYDLSHFYTVMLENVNTDILKAIVIFKKVGINLDGNSFNYSYYANVYMSKFLLSINNGSVDNDSLKVFFERIYWKCPDIITHIVANFKYLYFLHKRKFDEYYNKLMISLNNDGVKSKYSTYTSSRDNMIFNDKYMIIQSFLDKSDDINAYSSDKISNESKKIFSDIKGSFSTDDIEKLFYTLKEYKYYLRFKYIIDDIKVLYEEKDKYKNSANKIKKDIAKLEKVIFRNNKKINKLKDKFDKFDKLNGIVNSDILKVKDLYVEYERDLFLENSLFSCDNPTLYDMLLIASSNYDYLVNLMKNSNNNIASINNEIEELRDFVYYPYINIVNNILFNDEREIKHIIMDRYNLFGFDISEDELDYDNIDNLIRTTEIVLKYYSMNKLGVDSSKIKFVIDTNELINKARD